MSAQFHSKSIKNTVINLLVWFLRANAMRTVDLPKMPSSWGPTIIETSFQIYDTRTELS